MAAPIKSVQSSSWILLGCFCISLLGSQLFLMYNIYTLHAEISKLALGMRHCNYSNEFTYPLSSSYNFSTFTDAQREYGQTQHEANKDYQKTVLKSRNLDIRNLVNSTCDITEPEVLSAISRAKTDICKKQIADVVCRDQEGKLIPSNIPRLCPLRGDFEKGQYLGCYRDNQPERDFNVFIMYKEDNTPKKCVDVCINGGYPFAAVEFAIECWCGFGFGRHGRLPESTCSLSCPGDRSQSCGGYLALRVFSTGLLPVRRFRDVSLVRFPGEVLSLKPVRIVFALMVTGRAVRQIRRLIKAIYHPEHYIYIHVDKRNEYLYRELLKLEDVLPNLRLARDRITTLWGGASLLEATFAMMKSLLAMKDWDWDYYVNLSECAYPIKPTDMLAAFLRKYQGANFIKSHEAEPYHFIRMQGISELFYECGNYVYRLGQKKNMPSGIIYDGGSDWFGLHKDFCRYAVSSNDPLVTGLLQYARHSFSPLESFFHILLINSMFCNTQIDINLHTVSWLGPQGCSCMKRAIDGCGCSPGNMKPGDFKTLQALAEFPVFLARKFEAVVSQEIYNLLDNSLGIRHSDYSKLSLYWQSVYYNLDQPDSQTSVILAFGDSFIRRSTAVLGGKQGRGYADHQLIETTVLFRADKFDSYLVKFSLLMPGDSKCYYESRYSRLYHHKRDLSNAFSGRLQILEAGSDFDSKERIFRNYPGLFGPNTKVVIRHAWTYGPRRKVTFIWFDPAGKIVAKHQRRIARNRLVQVHNPKLKVPLQPGVWTVKVLNGQRQISSTKFLILPKDADLGVFDSHNHESCNKYIPSNSKAGQENQCQSSNRESELGDGEKSQNKGENIVSKIDELTADFWMFRDTCMISGDRSCPVLKPCYKTEWSSVSPDPKSEIHGLDHRGILI